MPEYNYRCETCCTTFFVYRSYASIKNREIVCPNCGSKDMTKLINKDVNVIFKGKGFYNTDNKKKEKETGT